MFYAIVGAGGRDQRELHGAHAPALAGDLEHEMLGLRLASTRSRPAGPTR